MPDSRRQGHRRKNRGKTRFVVRHSRELTNELRIVIGVVAALCLLVFFGFDLEFWLAIVALVAFVAIIYGLVREPSPIYEIVSEEEPYTRSNSHGEHATDALSEANDEPSTALKKALGPLATELHQLERQLLSQTGSGRWAAPEIALIAQELARERAELIGDQTPTADASSAAPSDKHEQPRE